MSEELPDTFCIYDADCGICSVLAKSIDRTKYGGWKPEFAELSITPELCSSTFIWVENGIVFTEARAVFKAMQTRRGLRLLGWVLGLRPHVWVLNWFYRRVAANRHRISTWLGLNACKIG